MRFKQRPFAPLTVLAIVFTLALLCQRAAGETKNIDTVREFLERTPLSASELADILEAVRSASPGSASPRREWVLSGDGKVYSLVLLSVQKDERAVLQTRLEEIARAKASLRAHHLLYLRAWSGTERKTRYASEESLAEALAEWDKGRGEDQRLKSDLSVAVTSKDWAFALVRAPDEFLKALRAQIGEMPESALDTPYCAALYPKARELFEQGRYEEALPIYQELHSLRWARPAAYLDAAECYSRTGDPESAARLAKETATELDDAMNHALLRRAGDILLDAGEEAPAERFYRRAIEKLRQE
jgi:tetratricopeptide (TPR) repeat protein